MTTITPSSAPNNPPITLTAAALNYVQSVIQRDCPGGILHLSVKKSGCSGLRYVLNVLPNPSSEDILTSTQDTVPIYTNSHSLPILTGMTLDMNDQGFGQKSPVFHNPNATDSCGCGESFRLKETDHG